MGIFKKKRNAVEEKTDNANDTLTLMLRSIKKTYWEGVEEEIKKFSEKFEEYIFSDKHADALCRVTADIGDTVTDIRTDKVGNTYSGMSIRVMYGYFHYADTTFEYEIPIGNNSYNYDRMCTMIELEVEKILKRFNVPCEIEWKDDCRGTVSFNSDGGLVFNEIN